MRNYYIPVALLMLATSQVGLADTTITATADQVVYDLPAGVETRNYLREGELFRQWGSDAIKTETLAATLSCIGESSDGKVYVSNPISSDTKGYLVGTRNGDSLKFTFPQVLQQGEGYLAVMRLEETTVEIAGWDGSPVTVPSYKISDKPQEIVFNLVDGNWVQTEDGEFGFVQEDGSWAGYGEFNQIYTPFNDKLVEVPEDARPTDIALRYVGLLDCIGDPSLYMLLHARQKDNALYIQGLSTQYPESWIMGTIQGDRIVFENGQFLGIGNRTIEYFCTGVDTPEYIPGYNTWNHVISLLPRLEMAYDASRGIVSALDKNDAFITNPSKSIYSYGETYLDCRLTPQPETVDPKPIMPVFKVGVNQWDNGMDPFLTFQLIPLNIYGQLLDTADLGFEIEIEGETYTFPAWDYWMEEDLTLVPWGIQSAFINMNYNGQTSVDFQCGFIRDLKIRAVNKVDGQLYYSDAQTPDTPQTQDPVDGIRKLTPDSTSPVVSTFYYDLQGNRIDNPGTGVYIICRQHEDGTITHERIIL